MKTMPERIMALINIELYRFPNMLIVNITVKKTRAFLFSSKAKGFWLIDSHAPIEKNKKPSIRITPKVPTVPMLNSQRMRRNNTINPFVYFINRCIIGEKSETIIKSLRNQKGPFNGNNPPIIFQYT